MKKRLVMGTLTAALIAGSVPYEIYAQQEEVVIQSEEEGQEEPAEPEQPEPAPSEEPQPTMEPEPTHGTATDRRARAYTGTSSYRNSRRTDSNAGSGADHSTNTDTSSHRDSTTDRYANPGIGERGIKS